MFIFSSIIVLMCDILKNSSKIVDFKRLGQTDSHFSCQIAFVLFCFSSVYLIPLPKKQDCPGFYGWDLLPLQSFQLWKGRGMEVKKLSISWQFLVVLVVTLQILSALDLDPYRVLGVSRTASQADIKKAYKKLAREW